MSQKVLTVAPGRRKAWLVLWVWAGLWALYAARGGAYSWHFFAQGADLVSGETPVGGGLHVYATHPELQIGPLALIAAVPLHEIGPWGGSLVSPLLLTVLGPLILKVLVDARDRHTRSVTSSALVLTTGLLLVPVWSEVAMHYAHLDDALALLSCALAVRAVLSGRPYLTALMLAAAVDCKPWAAGFGVLVLALPSHQRLRSAGLLVAGVVAAWLPFVVADPRTLAVGGFTIPNVASSALRALGAHAAHTPVWDRPAQLVLGVAVALVCIRRRRWTAVPLAVVAARLLLDPQTYPYYSSGLLVCTVIVDLLRPARRLPVWSAAAAAWYVTDRLGPLLLSPGQLGGLRASYCLAVLAALCFLPTDRGATPTRLTLAATGTPAAQSDKALAA